MNKEIFIADWVFADGDNELYLFSSKKEALRDIDDTAYYADCTWEEDRLKEDKYILYEEDGSVNSKVTIYSYYLDSAEALKTK